MRDPINEELHRYRHDHTRKFNFDLTAIFKDLPKAIPRLAQIHMTVVALTNGGHCRRRSDRRTNAH